MSMIIAHIIESSVIYAVQGGGVAGFARLDLIALSSTRATGSVAGPRALDVHGRLGDETSSDCLRGAAATGLGWLG